MISRKDALILIVDDNPQNLQVLGQMLKEAGYKLAVAKDGLKALEFAGKKTPHLILLDVMMPGIDGIETCRQLKSNERTADIPVIFLSGLTDAWNKTKAFEAGGMDFVTKPFDRDELLARVEVNVARKLAEDAYKDAEKKLRESNSALKQAVATKDTFSSIIAHDLRSSLNGMVGYSDLLSEKIEDLSHDEIREMATGLSASSHQLFNLLQNLLTWSQSQLNTLEFSPQECGLKLLIDESLLTLRQNAASKEIALHHDIAEDMLIYADPDMVLTVVRNLVSNAVKFTPPGGEINICANAIGLWMEVSVCDTGIGISAEDLRKLFRIDVHHTTRGTQNEAGTGLGLILCKEFIEKHGGHITVKSEIGTGSTFTFTLPTLPIEQGGKP